MESESTDLFLHAGNDYLVLVDRYSDYIFCSDALSKTNTSTILNVLIKWFQLLGYPSVISSDGGPQFRSEFDNFCTSKNITHELTSPYNPQYNGLAENAVKQAKHLLIKSLDNNENFQEALSEMCQTSQATLPLSCFLPEDKSCRVQLLVNIMTQLTSKWQQLIGTSYENGLKTFAINTPDLKRPYQPVIKYSCKIQRHTDGAIPGI